MSNSIYYLLFIRDFLNRYQCNLYNLVERDRETLRHLCEEFSRDVSQSHVRL